MHDYNARYYSAVLGRFVSPDSIVPEASSSGGFNRYRYARGNPLRYNDPSGHCGNGTGSGNLAAEITTTACRQLLEYREDIFFPDEDTTTWDRVEASYVVGVLSVFIAVLAVEGQLGTLTDAAKENPELDTPTTPEEDNPLTDSTDTFSDDPDESTFGDQMLSEEAERYTDYWERHAPEQDTPYATRRRYTPDGDIKQVTTYDKYGNRQTQFDLIDERGRPPHRHDFDYPPKSRPDGVRSKDHDPLDQIP